MATIPDTLPEWASDNPEVNDDTGQDNILEPPALKKQKGWNYGEFPVRNWVNWLHKKTYEWLAFFKAEHARVIVVHGQYIWPTLQSQLIRLSIISPSDPTLFYFGIGYVNDEGVVVAINTVGVSTDEYGTPLFNVELYSGGIRSIDAPDDQILVLEQLGGTNVPPPSEP